MTQSWRERAVRVVDLEGVTCEKYLTGGNDRHDCAACGKSEAVHLVKEVLDAKSTDVAELTK